MAFSEQTKSDVKRKAHYRCCICRNYFVEVHHIIPMKDGGRDDADNAAPLCPTCHKNFGDNAEKRKAIKEMRNFWYELCEKSETQPDVSQFSEKVDRLYDEFQNVKSNQEEANKILQGLSQDFSEFYRRQADQFTQVNSMEELIKISSTTASSLSVPHHGPEPFKYKACPNCGNVTMFESAQYCSMCGTKIQ
jgi:hypothetical protein